VIPIDKTNPIEEIHSNVIQEDVPMRLIDKSLVNLNDL